jgi:hypothetical protein
MSTVLNPSYALTLGNLRSLVVPTLTNEGQPAPLYVDPRGAALVSQDLPERAELARLGGTVIMRTDAVACVTAVPTTTAAHTLWNGESAGGKSYVIDRITWICTTSAGAASAFSFVAVVNKASTASVPATADTQAQTVYTTGKGYAGKAKTSHTVTVVDDVWFALGQTTTPSALTGTVGVGLDAPVNGAIVLAPGYVMGVSVMAVNTTAKGTCHFWFHEVQIPTVTS